MSTLGYITSAVAEVDNMSIVEDIRRGSISTVEYVKYCGGISLVL